MEWQNELAYDSSMASYWTNEVLSPDTIVTSQNPELLRGSMFQVSFARTHQATVTEDLATCTFHLSMRPGTRGLYTELNDQDAANVESDFYTAWWTAMAPRISNNWSVNSYHWRHFGADFPLDETGASKPGAIWRFAQASGVVGSSSGVRLPDQDAATVTYKTASRKHWGRNYIPGFTSLELGTFGHLSTTYVDLLANSTHAWFNAMGARARVIDCVVWSPRYRGILGINDLTVDDVVDIQRRRRAKFATYRKTFTA